MDNPTSSKSGSTSTPTAEPRVRYNLDPRDNRDTLFVDGVEVVADCTLYAMDILAALRDAGVIDDYTFTQDKIGKWPGALA